MRRQVSVLVTICAVVLGLAGGTAWALSPVAVNIPFSFIVKDKEMPAGHYEIHAEGNGLTKVVVRGGGTTLVVPVIERLADIGAAEPRVIFDRVDGKDYLSEIHIPGGDGFLVGIAKGKETHVVLKGKE